MSKTVIVVPCFNERRRLDQAAFRAFARCGQAKLLIVDDGSTDGTSELLRQLRRAAPEGIRVQTLTTNQGKAEAVRRGLLAALRDDSVSVVGYADADLSTPFAEITRLIDRLEQTECRVVIGARVALLGRNIERRAIRHYLGRVFATFASLILELPVYDTQCGAKLFRADRALRDALAEPFISRWAFDVELIGRLITGSEQSAPLAACDFEEVPLRVWLHIPDSKL